MKIRRTEDNENYTVCTSDSWWGMMPPTKQGRKGFYEFILDDKEKKGDYLPKDFKCIVFSDEMTFWT